MLDGILQLLQFSCLETISCSVIYAYIAVSHKSKRKHYVIEIKSLEYFIESIFFLEGKNRVTLKICNLI